MKILLFTVYDAPDKITFEIPDRFQMLFCLARRKLDATITSQVSISLTILKPEIVSPRELIVNNNGT